MDPNENILTDDLNDFEKELYPTEPDPSLEQEPRVDTPAETDEPELPLEPETPDEESTEDPDGDAKEEPEDPETPVRKKKTFQDRINEVLEGRREAREELEAWKRRYEELEAKVVKPVEPTPATPESGAPRYDATDENGELVYPLGEYDPKYIEDLTAYQVDKRLQTFEQKRQEEMEAARQQAALAEVQKEWNQKIDAAQETFPDIRERGQDLQLALNALEVNPDVAEYIASTIMSLDTGPEILYYLATNLDEAAEVFTSNQVAATLTIGALDADIKRTKARTTKKVSSAPEPPKALARGVGTMSDVPDDTDDLTAFERKLYRR
jgi:hypothetical protein